MASVQALRDPSHHLFAFLETGISSADSKIRSTVQRVACEKWKEGQRTSSSFLKTGEREVSLFTPIYTPTMSAFLRWVENYFSFGGQAFALREDGVSYQEENYEPTLFETACKVMSYATVVLPLFVLAYKTVQYLTRSKVQMLSADHECVQNVYQRALQDDAIRKHILWIPHPGLYQAHRGRPFPANEVCFGMVHGVKRCVAWNLRNAYGANENHFLQWLNSGKEINPNKNCFMNCADFVYWNLFQAGLISKDQIEARYRSQADHAHDMREKMAGREGEHLEMSFDYKDYYGFRLDEFSDFDLSEGKGMPGDILIGYIDGRPDHVMFLSGKHLETGEWKGVGLWNMANTDENGRPCPCNVELKKLQKACADNGQKLEFKHCSLQKALRSFT
jgi:hypothetical protein